MSRREDPRGRVFTEPSPACREVGSAFTCSSSARPPPCHDHAHDRPDRRPPGRARRHPSRPRRRAPVGRPPAPRGAARAGWAGRPGRGPPRRHARAASRDRVAPVARPRSVVVRRRARPGCPGGHRSGRRPLPAGGGTSPGVLLRRPGRHRRHRADQRPGLAARVAPAPRERHRAGGRPGRRAGGGPGAHLAGRRAPGPRARRASTSCPTPSSRRSASCRRTSSGSTCGATRWAGGPHRCRVPSSSRSPRRAWVRRPTTTPTPPRRSGGVPSSRSTATTTPAPRGATRACLYWLARTDGTQPPRLPDDVAFTWQCG